MKRSAQKLLVAIAAVSVIAALGALVAYAATTHHNPSAAQYQYGKKVTLCHKHHTIRVSMHALRAHLRHGDTLGACPAATTATTTTTTTSTSAATTSSGGSERGGHGHGHGGGHGHHH